MRRGVYLDAAARQPLADQVELIERAIANGHRPRARIGIGGYPHRQAEELLEVILHRHDVRIASGIARDALRPLGLRLSGGRPPGGSTMKTP